jgi:hypothetical protein
MKPDKFLTHRVERIYDPDETRAFTGIFGGGKKYGFVNGRLGWHDFAAFRFFMNLSKL